MLADRQSARRARAKVHVPAILCAKNKAPICELLQHPRCYQSRIIGLDRYELRQLRTEILARPPSTPALCPTLPAPHLPTPTQ